ncbi:MAG: carboxynorspermidine decarboxylase [Lachnospiraceae bacterium]|nr:carboxynorspermidine decarboxylase [Lachnospiraceae bacterium]
MDLHTLPTPCYVIDEARLLKNLRLLKRVREETGCRILLAQKAFSCFYEYPLIGEYLDGATASGLFEAQLSHEEMGKENHVFSPAYRADELDALTRLCSHIVFNSFSQLEKFYPLCRERHVHVGIRINPECSTQGECAIYDPCAAGSRLGVTRSAFRAELAPLLSGLHFHTLCEQDSDALEVTLDALEERFGDILSLPNIQWLNMGGGHHITRPDYDLARLFRCIRRMQNRYGVTVYLEPGEAVALNAGYLVTEIMDIVTNGIDTLILDASAACHMPDVLEMPYRPPLHGAGLPGEKPYTYRLASRTCLAGDVIGDYSFDHRPKPGDRLCFEDMAIYSMVKNNTFNGMALPAIAVFTRNGRLKIIRTFGYADFKGRLA